MAAKKRSGESDDDRSDLPERFKKHLRGIATKREVSDADESVRISPRRSEGARPSLLDSLTDEEDLD